jgi:periplasmic glucans biosynthesis protein
MRSFWKAQACRVFIGVVLAASLPGMPAHAFDQDRSASGQQPIPAISTLAEADRVFEVASKRAAELAAARYQPLARDLPAPFRDLQYDGYRKVRPKPEATVWGEAGNPFGFLPLPRGGLYQENVNLFVVENGETNPLSDASGFVDFVDFQDATPEDRKALGMSGWRAISRPGIAGKGYEAAVFQGGTYFRATAESLFYGVSARALAIGTGSPRGEEFPRFRDFWIIRPQANDDALAFVALSDSPSAAGAYRFILRPGRETTIEVAAAIHPRTDIFEAGIAPLSSMYLHGSADRTRTDDWRPEVHDSDGLSILSASGEWVWRPLTNPKAVQLSAFGADSPRGFGLMQRARDFAAYADLEAKYERRPSVWIEPKDDWGAGEIRLLEIPTVNEYSDNVAVFWRPAAPWKPGEEHRLAYTTRWSAAGPVAGGMAAAMSTRLGAKSDGGLLRHFVIDFSGDQHFAAAAQTPDVWASGGEIRNVAISDGPDAMSRRLTFDLDPKGASAIELHAALADETSQLTETWLFRWTPE